MAVESWPVSHDKASDKARHVSASTITIALFTVLFDIRQCSIKDAVLPK